MSHRARCGDEKDLVFSHVRAVQSPPFLCLSLERRDSLEGEGKGRQLQAPTERVGLVTAERGIVPLVWNYLNGRHSNKAKPIPPPPPKTELIQLLRGRAGSGLGGSGAQDRGRFGYSVRSDR